MPRSLILKVMLSPGDVCTLTAAIESLHATYPGEYLTDVRTSCDEIFAHNPRITKLTDADGELFELHYDTVLHRSDSAPNSFLSGYCDDLGRRLYLAEWESSVADLRIHGTTRRQVREAFEQSERGALQALPAGRFELFQEAQALRASRRARGGQACLLLGAAGVCGAEGMGPF